MTPAPTKDGVLPQAITNRVWFIGTVMLVVFLVGWLLWFWPYDDLLDRSGTPWGADFSMFYVAGQMAAAGEFDQLYNPAAQQTRLHALFPGIHPQFTLPYRYPPTVALVMAPLASLPYALAFALFMVLGLASAITGVWLLMRQSGVFSQEQIRLGYLALFGWPVVLETWIGGQASLFALLLVCVGIVLMQRERFAWAGVVWALAAYKPNVLLLVVVGCVLFRPRVLRGLLPAGAILLGLTWWGTGWPAITEYVELTFHLAARPWDVETPFWKVHGLAQSLTPLLGVRARIITMAFGLLATCGVVWRWRATNNSAASREPYALLITINALANPYAPIYDLTLLSAALILLVPTLANSVCIGSARRLAWCQAGMAAIYCGPHLSQAVAKVTGQQFFPLLLLVCGLFQAWLFWRGTTSQRTTKPHQRVDAAHRCVDSLRTLA